MTKLAKYIRIALKSHGFNNRNISVRCDFNNGIIKIETKLNVYDDVYDPVISIIKSIYHKENHCWFCVSVNNFILPMEA